MSVRKFDLMDLVSDPTAVKQLDQGFLAETAYDGTYADLASHDEIKLIEALKNQPWRKVIEEFFFEQKPWLYRIITDPGRSLFLDLLPIKRNGVYFDIGSGWGQVTIPLSKHGLSVAFDLTYNRLEILRQIALQEKAALGYLQGNFLTFPFRESIADLIVFNGSLEWIGSGRPSDMTIRECQLEALNKAGRMLKPDGIIYIGIENSLGAKYLSGVKDDHTGIPHLMYLNEKEADERFRAIASTRLPAKTWSLNEYYELFDEAGLVPIRAYGCFPDYKLIRLMIDLEEIDEYFLENVYDISEHDGTDGTLLSEFYWLGALYEQAARNRITAYVCPSFAFVLKKKD
jgi:SAM-dependent methyltransferase